MPASSTAQRRAAAMAEHASPEKLASAGPAVRQMAKGMSKDELHKFASTKESHLPHHKKPHHRGENRDGRSPKERGR